MKGAFYLVAEGTLKAGDATYANMYYKIKERIRGEHKEIIKENGKIRWNKGHIHAIAMNRVSTAIAIEVWKIFGKQK